MGAVLRWPRRRPVELRALLVALQLQTAKEILGEIFGTAPADVEEMIRQRCEERGSWPERFKLTDQSLSSPPEPLIYRGRI